MKNNAIKWLYAVPEKKKLYILTLMLVQALHGASGVLYALLLRNIVDNATAHDKAGLAFCGSDRSACTGSDRYEGGHSVAQRIIKINF